LLLPITIFFTIIFFVLVRPEWRANHNYIEHRCTVLNKRMGVNRGDESTTYRPEIYVRYVVDGREFRVWTYDASGSYGYRQSVLDSFSIGAEYPLWYDPANPEKAVLVRGYSWWPYLATRSTTSRTR
jgi:hypothetical protein